MRSLKPYDIHRKSLPAFSIAFIVFVILGASIAYIGPLAGFIEISITLATCFILILILRKSNIRYWVFITALLLPLPITFFKKYTNISFFGAWQVIICFFSLLFINDFLKVARQQRFIQLFLLAFFLFITFGIFSTFTGRSQFYATAYQFISDLKPLLAVSLGFALRWDSRMERLLFIVIRWLWLPAILLVFFEWAMPNLYFNIFSAGYGKISADPTGLLPSRASGFFDHPAMLASTSAAFCLLAVSRALILNQQRKIYWFLASMYFLLIVFAVQRQELASCMAVIFLIYLLAEPKHFKTRVLQVLALSVLSVVAFWSVFSKTFIDEAAAWGFGTISQIEHPRAQIFSGAWQIALEYFPFGSGLGTFGGAGAEKFDTSLYEHLGFKNYWWYGKEDFLMDTYWPNSIAETGIFGAISLLMSYIFLFVFALNQCLKVGSDVQHYWAATTAMMGYTLLLSFSSPSFQDLRLFLLPALMFGISSKVTQDARNVGI